MWTRLRRRRGEEWIVEERAAALRREHLPKQSERGRSGLGEPARARRLGRAVHVVEAPVAAEAEAEAPSLSLSKAEVNTALAAL